ncbi:MAG: carboxypeptidase-like regulatory domain-containing protein, partial [Planctomycetota bacterium]
TMPAGTDAAAAPTPAAAGVAPTADTSVAVPGAAVATTAVLFGSVKRADGTLVSLGGCWLQRDGKQVGTQNLAEGTFAFAGLQPGPHRLTSRIADELALDREVMVTAPTTRLDLELPARWLLHVNVVTTDGAPLVEAIGKQQGPMLYRTLRALAFPERLANDLPRGVHAEIEAGLGGYRGNEPFFREAREKPLPKQTVGVLTLPTGQSAHVALLFGATVLAQQAATPGQEALTFVLAPAAVMAKTGTVRVRCVDAAGAPVIGARVHVGSTTGLSISEKLVTDEQGRYVARDLVPGRVTVSVYQQGLRMPPLQTELGPGEDVDFGDVTLRPAVEVEISFAEFGGDGSVRLLWLDAPPGSRSASSDGYHSAQNGTLQKASLYPGRYAALARGRRGVAWREFDTAALPPGPLRFDLRPGAPLRIDNRVGAGVASFEIATARGVPVQRGDLGSRGGFTVDLPPGDFVVTIDTGSAAPARRSFALPAGGATLTLP